MASRRAAGGESGPPRGPDHGPLTRARPPGLRPRNRLRPVSPCQTAVNRLTGGLAAAQATACSAPAAPAPRTTTTAGPAGRIPAQEWGRQAPGGPPARFSGQGGALAPARPEKSPYGYVRGRRIIGTASGGAMERIVPITTRNPKTVAAELVAHRDQASRMFVPPNVLTVIDLATEFAASVAERLDAAGLATDPSPDVPEEPVQS